jgi:hypothetical protein
VHYEDLVTSLEVTAKNLFAFLGVADVGDVSAECLSAPHDAHGSGDYKIWATTQITAGSVGRGVTVPAEAIPAPLRAAVNALLGELGYVQVDEQWNVRAGDPMLARELRAHASVDSIPPPAGDLGSLDALEALLIERIRDRLARTAAPLFPPQDRDPSGRPAGIAITATSERQSAASRTWRVDLALGEVGRGEPAAEDGDWQLSGDVETWHSVLGGKLNFGVALRQGRLRCVRGPHRFHQSDGEPLVVIANLLGISPLAMVSPEA